MPTSSRKKVTASKVAAPTKQTRSSRRSSTRGNKAKDKEEEVLDDTNQNNDALIPSTEEANINNEKAASTEPQVVKKTTTEQMEDGDSKPAAVDQSQANMNNMMMQQQSSNNQYLPSNAYLGSNYMGMMNNNFSPMAMSNDPAMQAMMQMASQMQNGGGGSFNYPQAVVQTSAAEAKNFPETLFDVTSDEDTNHIISWLAHGKGFMITDKQAFAKVLLPNYFDGCKFTSFTRRLKRWNFERVARGPEIGAYYNPCFQRDKPEWVLNMRYRMEGSQFADAKAQSQDKMPGSADVVLNNNGPIPEDQMHDYQQNYVLSSKISSQTREYFANGPADVLPLPSALPKRSKKKKEKASSMPPLGNPQHEEMRMMELQQQMIMARSMQSQSVAGMPSLPGMPQAYDPSNNPPEIQQDGGLKTVLMTNEEQKSYLEYKAMKQNGEV